MATIEKACPTCGAVTSETQCDHCSKVIADSSSAMMVSSLQGPARYLCAACQLVPLSMASLGAAQT